MSDIQSQFSEAPMPSKQPSTQFSEEPMPPPAPEALAAPPSVKRRLRLWPGVVIIALQWIVVKGIAYTGADDIVVFQTMFMGPMVGALCILIWWLAASRLSWVDRLVIPAACAFFGASVAILGDQSMHFGLLLYGLPAVLTAWIVWLVVSIPARWPIRRAGLAVVFMLVWGYFGLLRFDGVTGGFASELAWRWTPTTEEKFIAERVAIGKPNADLAKSPALTLQAGDWPSFRGPNCDSRLTGVKIRTDWDKDPPKLLWRHKVGPGWGSFAVVGKHLFTQEQWDKNEVVVCYDTGTGDVIWAHEVPERFSEVIAGPGPRATPTFHEGKVYAMGAAGKLCCLDAASGREIWTQDIILKDPADPKKWVWSKDFKDETEGKLPVWGFAASPLVLDGIVMVYAGAPGKAVVGYDANTGKFAWAAGKGEQCYSSLQRASFAGVAQALLETDVGLTAYQAKDGKVLWEHQWKFEGARCVQPAVVGDADLLFGTPFSKGMRRLHITKKDDRWDASEVWFSKVISPYFNDLVVDRDHLYGFNGEFFTCVSIDKGKQKWKERGYGCGQVLVFADQKLLLIVTEQGEVALVEANPEELKELHRFKAIEGKTWNHPVYAYGKLFVRNGVEAACYELAAPK